MLYPVYRLAGLAALGFAACAYGRPLATGLTGKELLVEYRRRPDAPTGAIPGIYAIGLDGSCRRVITHGLMPKWSPDHRFFAYIAIGGYDEPCIWVADLRKADCSEVEGVSSALAHAPVFHEMLMDPEPFVWLPDSSGLIHWRVNYSRGNANANTQVPKFEIEVVARHKSQLHPEVLEPYTLNGMAKQVADAFRMLPSSVGRVSIRPAGDVIAYERLRLRSSLGVVARGIGLCDLATGKHSSVDLPLEDGEILLNPLFSPCGKYLAVDVSGTGGNRRCVLLDYPGLGVMATLAGVENWRSVSAVGWRPDGRGFVVNAAQGELGDQLYELPFPWRDPAQGAFNLSAIASMPPYPRDFRWSPDSDAFALLGGAMAETVESAFSSSVVVAKVPPSLTQVPTGPGVVPFHAILVNWESPAMEGLMATRCDW